MPGYKLGDTSLVIEKMPDRKRWALYSMVNNKYMAQFYPLAWFVNEEAAIEAGRLLDLLAKGTLYPGVE